MNRNMQAITANELLNELPKKEEIESALKDIKEPAPGEGGL